MKDLNKEIINKRILYNSFRNFKKKDLSDCDFKIDNGLYEIINEITDKLNGLEVNNKKSQKYMKKNIIQSDQLKDILNEVNEKLDENNDNKLRINNLKKEKKELVDGLIGIVDFYDSIYKFALSIDNKRWIYAMERILKKINLKLNALGIIEIEALNEKFNPYLHKCIDTFEDENMRTDEIIEVYKKGYRYNHEIIRPAEVKVIK